MSFTFRYPRTLFSLSLSLFHAAFEPRVAEPRRRCVFFRVSDASFSPMVAVAAFHKGMPRGGHTPASSSSPSFMSLFASRLLSSLFSDADDITDTSEAILVLGPQLCYYMLYILAFTAVFISVRHAWQFRHRSLLLRIARNALGWKDDSDFMPSYAAKDDEATTRTLTKPTSSSRGNGRDILSMLKYGAVDDGANLTSRSRREKALRDVQRLETQLNGFVAETTGDDDFVDVDVTTVMATLRENTRRTDTRIAGRLYETSTTDEYDIDNDRYVRQRSSSRRPFSAREELLRRRGTSLASACRLLDESHAMHHRASLPRSSTNPLHRRRLPPPLDPSSPHHPPSLSSSSSSRPKLM